MKKEKKLKTARSFSPPKKMASAMQEITEEPDSNRPKEYYVEFNDKNKLKLQHKAASEDQFFCDDKTCKMDPRRFEIKFSQIGESETIFNKLYFFEFLAYQIIFFFFLGPFLAGLLFFLNKNSSLSRNQHFWGFNHMFFLQTFQYMITVTNFCLYYIYYPKYIYTVEVYMLVIHLIIYFCIKAIKFATMNHNKMDFFKNKRLTDIDYASEFLMGMCFEIKTFDIEKELQATILRKEIDIGLFGFRFITPMKQKYSMILRDEIDENDKNLTALRSTKLGAQTENLKNKVKDCPGNVYSGFSLAGLLLKQNQKHLLSKTKLNVISIFFGVTSALIPNLVRVIKNGSWMGESQVENYMIFSLFIGTLIFVYNNCLILINSIYEYDQVFQYLSQMSNLLSPRRLSYYYSKKYLPTIDFFEPFSFKSWGILHRVLRNYGKKQKTRVDCQLTIFLLAALIFVVCLILSVFNYLGTFSGINIAVFLYQTAFILMVLLIILKKGMAINKVYALHITILKNNKNILSDLLRLHEIYFSEKFVPENEIYLQGIIVLRKLSENMLQQNFYLKQKNTGEDKQLGVIKKVLKNLIKISDDLIEELRLTLENEPFSVLSFPATEDFVQSVALVIASGIVAVLKKIIVE